MAGELPSPLYSGFFPQMVLTVDELMHYRRFGKERVNQLVRIIDDADCVYRWTDLRARNGRVVQKAQFLDIRPVSKQPASQQPSTLLKSSIHIVDVQPEEILQAIAKVKTRDARRMMSYLHGDEFVDTQTLLTFPTSADHKKPSYSYRAIKWCLLKAKRREGQKSLDFCYLEYAGKRKALAGASSVVGFCVQESIARDREVPTLERYDILRGQFMRTGILITKTHQSNILKVTTIAQIDGSLVPTAVRLTMEEIMVDYVATVHRVKGLLERQRMGRLQYLDEWDWVSTKERKACAVCLRGFYFHRKHHCATCGEVVCSNCAPLRELEEPLDEHTHSMRVCSVCMAQAGSAHQNSMISGYTESEDGMLETTTTTTNVGTETYVGGLRYPKHRGLRRGGIEESVRGPPSTQAPMHSPLPPFRQRQSLPSRHSIESSEFDDDDASERHSRAISESARRERRSSVLRHSALSSSSSAKSKKEALDKLVEHVRQIRDTINVAISEAEEEEERHSMLLESGRGDPDAGAERYDVIYDRIMKIRDTLDMSSSDFDAVLESIGHNDPVRPSETSSGRLDTDLAFSYSDGTASDRLSGLESHNAEFLSSRSSFASGSVQSLDHQDAGEPMPSPTHREHSTSDEERALEEAMRWAHQSEPIAHLSSARPASPVPAAVVAEEPVQEEPTESTPVVTVSKNRGIARLAQKIGRLQQRLEASQRESETSSNASSPEAVAAVTPAPLGVPPVVQELDENTNGEPEPEQQPATHRRQSSAPVPVLKKPQGSAPHPPKEKHVAIDAGAIPSSPSSSASRGSISREPHLSEPSRAPPDLVASLRGVMNSSELTLPPPRRRSGGSTAPSPSPPDTPSNDTPSTFVPIRTTHPSRARRAPPPPPPAAPPALPPFSSSRPTALSGPAPTPVQGTTIYVYDPEDTFHTVQRRSSLDRRPLDADATETTTADNIIDESNQALSPSNEESGQSQTAPAAPSANRRTRARDESGELRELMEGLAKAPLRSRCSSGQSTGAPPTEKFDF
ncbi:hypothetical protein PHYBOEH_008392 [Phytophthora boehmeriae]|uniref:FYVE-type domain-containing protein n=1 Tax=Phytophthora boehmeriae TaxID=109152 RepID=A0A8T1X2W4_9STRA|nr:hypothetical protein PHYBOEH_008392 [Phytophthora boehmeriae]